MVKDIEKKEIKIIFKDEYVPLPIEIKEKIDNYWKEEVTKKTPELWNGDVFCVTNYKMTPETMEIVSKKSNYAHYIYDERIGLPPNYACPNLSGGAVLETLDGHYIVGELDEKTSYPFCLQLTGGNVDKQDINKDKIEIIKTIKREVKEEINLDLDNKQQIENYQIKYISLPEGQIHGYMIFVKGMIKMTAKEMKQYYEEYLQYLKENNLEIEFEKIHLISKKEIGKTLEKMENPKRQYLQELLEIDSQNG